nr:sn-glycerol-3-phosphate-binding periplasmic proteinUgpB precursor [Candidatus Pantoea persica]
MLLREQKMRDIARTYLHRKILCPCLLFVVALMSAVLGLAISGNALAATKILFWPSMEGELGKEVDSLAQRFNQAHPDYKIVPTYKGNYEQSLAVGIAAVRTSTKRSPFCKCMRSVPPL